MHILPSPALDSVQEKTAEMCVSLRLAVTVAYYRNAVKELQERCWGHEGKDPREDHGRSSCGEAVELNVKSG